VRSSGDNAPPIIRGHSRKCTTLRFTAEAPMVRRAAACDHDRDGERGLDGQRHEAIARAVGAMDQRSRLAGGADDAGAAAAGEDGQLMQEPERKALEPSHRSTPQSP
jgi:hypothetical protein